MLAMIKTDYPLPVGLTLMLWLTSVMFTGILQPNFKQFTLYPNKRLLVHKNPRAFYQVVALHSLITSFVIMWYAVNYVDPLIIFIMSSYFLMIILAEFLRFSHFSILVKIIITFFCPCLRKKLRNLDE